MDLSYPVSSAAVRRRTCMALLAFSACFGLATGLRSASLMGQASLTMVASSAGLPASPMGLAAVSLGGLGLLDRAGGPDGACLPDEGVCLRPFGRGAGAGVRLRRLAGSAAAPFFRLDLLSAALLVLFEKTYRQARRAMDGSGGMRDPGAAGRLFGSKCDRAVFGVTALDFFWKGTLYSCWI